jgi:glucokinase
MRVIAGDIGGTKTLLAVADVEGASVKIVVERRFVSADHASFEDLLRRFVSEDGGISFPTCLGVAGPVVEGVCKVTNLPWTVDATELEAVTCCPVRLLNDFEATAYGVANVATDAIVTIHEGVSVPHAPRAVLGAGTGLGEAIAYWSRDRFEVLATEGGHTDFAPRNDDEIALLRWLLARHAHVSYERVVSGAGLVAVYEFLRERAPERESHTIREEMLRSDPAAVIGQHAVAGDDALSGRAFDLFAGVYGAEAGNLALKCLARGGIYIAGGIAAKVLPRLLASPFLTALHDKGRMSPLVRAMPVRVVTDERVGLLGAAAYAARIG